MKRARAMGHLLLIAALPAAAGVWSGRVSPSCGAPVPGHVAAPAFALAAADPPRRSADAPRAAQAAPVRTPEGYRLAVPPYAFEFPRDHAAHPAFRTEWWYYTGHLDGVRGAYGFELTFFRVGLDRSRERDPSRWAFHTLYVAHVALTDLSGRRFMFEERLGRPGLGLAGADSTTLHVWIEDWSVRLAADGITHLLAARTDGFGIELALEPRKPPVIHGHDGVSQKAEGFGRASHYYSLTRLEGAGRVMLEGREEAVRASAWMDQEFGSNQLAPGQTGWDWFSLQLDDQRELMLYRMRRDDGGADPHSSGTLVEPDGRATHLPLAAYAIEAHGTWKSPHTGATYPSGWTLRVPSEGLVLTVTPNLADQELLSDQLGVHYWEGSVRASGTRHGRPVAGRGYVELTGYAGRVPGF